MTKLIGTAGHVDHGKSALVRALTQIDPDRLPEEKKIGCTIDIGFAYLYIPCMGRISIVDVPGHQKFSSNMLVGALGMDLPLLCVAADESVMPQTLEHLQILDLLPVEEILVVMTRVDCASNDQRHQTRDAIRKALRKTRFENVSIVETSSVTLEGIDTLRLKIAELCSKGKKAEPIQGSWYLPIDRVFSSQGQGTVVTGTLAGGKVQQGDLGVVLPGGHRVKIRFLEVHGERVGESTKGQRTALNLSGIKKEKLFRGQAIGSLGSMFESEVFDAKMRWTIPPKHGMRIRVSIGSAEVMGKLFLNDYEPTLAQFRLEKKIALAPHQPLIARKFSPVELLGGGTVLVPTASPRRRSEAPQLAANLSEKSAILHVMEHYPEGVSTQTLAQQVGRSLQHLGGVFEELKSSKQLFSFSGLWFTQEQIRRCSDRFVDALKQLHEKFPGVAYIAREEVLKLAGLHWSGKPLDRLVKYLEELGYIRVQGTFVAHVNFRVRLKPKQGALLDLIKLKLSETSPNVPSSVELGRLLSIPVQAVNEILRLGIEAGEIIRVAPEIYYTYAQINNFAKKLCEISTKEGFTASDFRKSIQTSRKYAIPLLEYLDRQGMCERVGDKRIALD